MSTETETPRTEAERDSVIGAMPWYDESDPDYSELDAVLAAIRAEAARQAMEDVAERVRAIIEAASYHRNYRQACIDVLTLLSKEEGS